MASSPAVPKALIITVLPFMSANELMPDLADAVMCVP